MRLFAILSRVMGLVASVALFTAGALSSPVQVTPSSLSLIIAGFSLGLYVAFKQ